MWSIRENTITVYTLYRDDEPIRNEQGNVIQFLTRAGAEAVRDSCDAYRAPIYGELCWPGDLPMIEKVLA